LFGKTELLLFKKAVTTEPGKDSRMRNLDLRKKIEGEKRGLSVALVYTWPYLCQAFAFQTSKGNL